MVDYGSPRVGVYVLMQQGRNEPVSVAVTNKGKKPLPLTHRLNGSDPYQHGILDPKKSKVIPLLRMGQLEITLGEECQELAISYTDVRNLTALKQAQSDPATPFAPARRKPTKRRAPTRRQAARVK